jgi:hypothetical protein
LIFDYEEARKAGKTEAPAEIAEKCKNGVHHQTQRSWTTEKERWSVVFVRSGEDDRTKRPRPSGGASYKMNQ